MVRLRRNTLSVQGFDAFHSANNEPRTPSRRARLDMCSLFSLLTKRTSFIFAAIFVVLTLLLFTPHAASSYQSLTKSHKSRFHLLVPASNSNKDLCRLLLSSIILNYPVPVLINWDAAKSENPFEQHLRKINTVLEYLNNFPPQQDDDLVLMVDGYDIWFQLPPEVLIRRYFDVVKTQNEQLKSKHGARLAKEKELYQTVVFGTDKVCWPNSQEEGGRPACWAVPQSPVPKYSFGPYEDGTVEDALTEPYQCRPRWLNSGSVMGPVKDVRALFEAVAARVKHHEHGASDQYYFATIWGFQEFARTRLDPNATFPDGYAVPDLDFEVGDSHKIEHHVTLDYESALFQPIGFYDHSLSWLLYDGSIQAGRPKSTAASPLDTFELDETVKKAQPPLAAMSLPTREKLNPIYNALFAGSKTLRLKQWTELPLLSNVITKQTAPLLHFMMEKSYRVKWWERMWFVPFSRDLLRASATAVDIPMVQKSIEGRRWQAAEGPVLPHDTESSGGRRDGAWSDKGAWLSWDGLCQPYDEYIFSGDTGSMYNDG